MSTITIPPHQLIPVDELRNPVTNPNHMPEDRYQLLLGAIKKGGFLQPILVYPDPLGGFRIIDGFHRTKAAKELDMGAVPAVVVDSAATGAKILQIGMNRLRGELNLTEVAESLSELAEQGIDVDTLTSTGFSAHEISELLAIAHPSDDAALGEEFSLEPSDDARPGAAKPFTLELVFVDAATLKKVKRKLRKAAGKGNDLTTGLLNLVEGG